MARTNASGNGRGARGFKKSFAVCSSCHGWRFHCRKSGPNCVCGAKWPTADFQYAQQLRKAKGGNGDPGNKEAEPPATPPREDDGSEDDAGESTLGSSSSAAIAWADVLKRASDQGLTIEVKNLAGEVFAPEGLLTNTLPEPVVEMDVAEDPPDMGTKERKNHE